MVSDIVLFWAFLIGLLVLDNLVLLPAGGDCLRLGRTRRFEYRPEARLQLRGRELVLLNPLNPFDRLLVTTASLGALHAVETGAAQRRILRTLPGVDLLSWLGSGYAVALASLCVASFQTYFGVVLLALVSVHLLMLGACVGVLVKHQARLGLDRRQVVALALDAALVPGHLVNLGKRVWLRQVLALPALALGLHRLRRMPDGPERELYLHRIGNRLEEAAYELDVSAHGSHDTPARKALETWTLEARKCLKTSAPTTGS